MKTAIFVFSEAFEVDHQSNLFLCRGIDCVECRKPFEIGQWARMAYGPDGGRPFHDDCTDAMTGTEVELTMAR